MRWACIFSVLLQTTCATDNQTVTTTLMKCIVLVSRKILVFSLIANLKYLSNLIRFLVICLLFVFFFFTSVGGFLSTFSERSTWRVFESWFSSRLSARRDLSLLHSRHWRHVNKDYRISLISCAALNAIVINTWDCVFVYRRGRDQVRYVWLGTWRFTHCLRWPHRRKQALA